MFALFIYLNTRLSYCYDFFRPLFRGGFMDKSAVLRLAAGVALIATLGFTNTTASDTLKTLCSGFIPENTMNIPVGMFDAGGITEKEFNDIMDRVEKLYTPDITKLGDTLQIKRNWTDGTVNASAQRFGNTEVLNMYGGLARHPSITVEGFALVVCHELGHHLGGAPKVNGRFGSNWATNEGGADYYATLKCLRRFFAEDDNAPILAHANLDPLVISTCQSQFTDQKDQMICMRTSMAGQSVADFFQVAKKEKTPPSYGTPDTSVVRKTNDAHPATQCRLDTMFAGFTCHVPESEPNDKTDYRRGSCYSPNDTIGVRPLCWFAPDNAVATRF
jgi:hypothetical protein